MGGGLTAVCAAGHSRWKPRLAGLQHQAGALLSRFRDVRLSEQMSSQDLGYTEGGGLCGRRLWTPQHREKSSTLSD